MASITGFGYETYFLTVADVATLFREMGMRHQARGSGVASLVNYLLRVGMPAVPWRSIRSVPLWPSAPRARG
jgi:hypothetical protein